MSAPLWREETRRERYDRKALSAKTLPVSICTVNFGCDENLGLVIRAAVCYGAESVMVIGSIPSDTYLRPKTGSTLNYIKLLRFDTPHDFLEHCRANDLNVVSAELCDDATDLNHFGFDFSKKTVIVVGNENTGVPAEIIHNSQPVFIPMNGIGYSMNTGVTAGIVTNEYSRQFSLRL